MALEFTRAASAKRIAAALEVTTETAEKLLEKAQKGLKTGGNDFDFTGGQDGLTRTQVLPRGAAAEQ